jgi:hypothetical protein
MGMSDDERKAKARIFDLLVNNYGVPGRVLNRRNHTNVFADDKASYDLRDIEEKFRDPDTGELSAQALKHWKLMDRTLDYLRVEYGIFKRGNLYTTCPIHPYFGKTSASDRRRFYQNKFRAYIQYVGTIAFTCDSRLCPWDACDLHHSKFPGKKDLGKQKFDIFNLMQILAAIKGGLKHPRFRHGLDHYRKKLADSWNMETLPLKSGPGEDRGGLGYAKYKGYKVEKSALMKKLYMSTNNEKMVQKFIEETRTLILKSPLVDVLSQTRSPHHCHIHQDFLGILNELGVASKIWLYIWMRCEEERAAIEEDVSKCIRDTGLSRRSYNRFREELKSGGWLFEDEQGRISVRVKK